MTEKMSGVLERIVCNLAWFSIVVLQSCIGDPQADWEDRDDLDIRSTSALYNGDSEPYIIDFIGTDENSGFSTSSFISDDYRLIPLETRDDNLIGRIDKALFTNGKIYVLDRNIAKQLFCFDSTGVFLHRVGARGRGPGEYDDPKDFDVVDGKIYLMDRQSRVFIYDLNADLIKVIKLPFLSTQVAAMSDSSLFVYSHEREGPYYTYLRQLNPNLTMISQDFEIPSELVSMYGIQQAFSKNGDQLLFSKFLSDTLFSVSAGEIRPKFVIRHSYGTPEIDWFDKSAIDAYQNSVGGLFHRGYGEFGNILLFFVEKDNSILTGLYDTENQILTKYSGFSEDMFLLGLSNYFPVGFMGEKMLFHFDSGVFIQSFSRLLERYKDQPEVVSDLNNLFAKVHRQLPDASANSNPAILVARLNPNAINDEK